MPGVSLYVAIIVSCREATSVGRTVNTLLKASPFFIL